MSHATTRAECFHEAIKADGIKCYSCGIVLATRVHRRLSVSLDHLWPRAYGGSSDAVNLLPVCEVCNAAKADRITWDVFGVVNDYSLMKHGQNALLLTKMALHRKAASALLRPDIFRAVVAMSVPYRARPPVAPLKALRDAGTTNFYWLYFQTPGVAGAEFERDVDRTVRTLLYGTGVSLMMKPGQGFLGDAPIPEQLPSWLTDEDVSYYVETYKRTGYRGGLNWYRNMDRNWALSGGWEGLKVQQPALFIAGGEDGVIKFAPKPLEQLPTTVPGLKKILIVPDSGHWIQQQRPAEVNAAILEFLRPA
jgi:hypothetical protein